MARSGQDGATCARASIPAFAGMSGAGSVALLAATDDVVRCTVFLDDMATFAEMNAVYREYFPSDKPARSTFGVDGLALGAALEIECLAVKR